MMLCKASSLFICAPGMHAPSPPGYGKDTAERQGEHREVQAKGSRQEEQIIMEIVVSSANLHRAHQRVVAMGARQG